MKLLFIVMFLLAWLAATGFLCAAAIMNPNLNDTEQFVWSAVAVGFTTLLAFYVFMLVDD